MVVMTGTIHPLQAEQEKQDTSPAMPRSVYLEAYLAPLRPWLERESVTEILVNRPGELWIEDAAHPGMQRIELPEIDDRLLQRLAEQAELRQLSEFPTQTRRLAGHHEKAVGA